MIISNIGPLHVLIGHTMITNPHYGHNTRYGIWGGGWGGSIRGCHGRQEDEGLMLEVEDGKCQGSALRENVYTGSRGHTWNICMQKSLKKIRNHLQEVSHVKANYRMDKRSPNYGSLW